ncbi:MAG: flagellar biosynthesis anti-sigma factor FlgM [Bacillota bacterium]|jgi:negative regulator of flagellin synthesis FlgM|nr:flagellar biosynthesis anti-sigma factor FlgM [Bacillota bacterium]
MRIEAYNKVSQLYNTSKVNKTNKTETKSFSDKLEISQTAMDYRVAKQIVAKTPDVREDKISEIKKRMEAGTYKVSNRDFAEKVVNRYFDELA